MSGRWPRRLVVAAWASLVASCAGSEAPKAQQGADTPAMAADTSDAREPLDSTGESDGELAEVEEPVDAGWSVDAADDVVEPADVLPPLDVPEPPPPPSFVTCDAGDEAWVKAVLPVLLGRRPTGLRETRVLAEMVRQSSRATVARGLMRSPEYLTRWSAFFLDELRVNRVGSKANPACYGVPALPADQGQLAAFIRDTSAASDAKYSAAFTMADVVRSSLVLDDVSPLYRANLFAMLKAPLTGANVDELQLDIARRQDFGEAFEATYLHRNVVCASCHNSAFAATDNPDPALDRHWPLPGLVEKALYGASAGRPEMELFANFRVMGVVREGSGRRPWRLDPACGRFTAPADLAPDPAGVEGFFITPQGLVASVWNIEEALRQGFERLRADGKLVVEPTTLAVEGPAAFAYLVSVRVTNQVWREVMGAPLTLVHYFPRNEAQRDLLAELTREFIASGFSVRALLLAIVTGPFFNENEPIDGCGEGPYALPALFNPWILEEPDLELHGNSLGDLVHRYDGRVLLSMVERALGWPASPSYPDADGEALGKAIGAFVKDAEPGFDGVDFQGLLAWEARMARCELTPTGGAAPSGTCEGACGGQSDGECFCDAPCVASGDCCADYAAVCGATPAPDTAQGAWFQALADAVATAQVAGDTVTVADVASAVKDRLVTAPDLTQDEGPLLASLFGADGVNTPVASLPGWLDAAHVLCGALASSPDFLLAGLPAPDQGEPPRLVVDGESYVAACERAARVVFAPALWTVTCGDDTLTVTPFAPPLGGAPASKEAP